MTEKPAQTFGIDHLGLTVSDLDASLGFFTDCIGWEKFGGNADYPSAYITDGTSKITLWATKSHPAVSFDRHRNVGLHHVALKAPTADALNAIYGRVCDWLGVTVEFAPEFSGAGPKVHFMITEPGGNRLEFAYDPR